MTDTLEAIRADPDSDAARLVHADWLDEQGHREAAELIRVQCAYHRQPPDDVDWTRVAHAQGLLPRAAASWDLPDDAAYHLVVDRGLPSSAALAAPGALPALARRLPALRELSRLHLTAEEAPVLARLPALERLQLANTAALPTLPRLRALALGDLGDAWSPPPPEALPALEHLRCPSGLDAGWPEALAAYPRLRSLGGAGWSADDLSSLARALPRLEHLTLCDPPPASLTGLRPLRALRALELIRVEGDLAPLRALPLEDLVVIGPYATMSGAELAPLLTCTSLRSLTLMPFGGVRASALGDLSELPDLRELAVSVSQGHLWRYIPSLGLTSLTDVSAAATTSSQLVQLVAGRLPTLRELSLVATYDNPLLTTRAASALVAAAPALERITLHGPLMDDVVLALGQLPSLRVLELARHRHVTVAAMYALRERRPDVALILDRDRNPSVALPGPPREPWDGRP